MRYLIALAVGLAAASAVNAQEWTRFRGPNGSGVGAGEVPVRWGEKEVAWKAKLPGVGHSSPVLWGERIFVTAGDNATGTRYVVCLRADNGKELWRRDYPGEKVRRHADNSGASSTPVVDGERVYVCWASPKDYTVAALTHDGKEAWRVDLGPYRGGHGFGASPVLHGGLVIVPNEQEGKSAIVALDAVTGKPRWRVERKSKSAWSTPCLVEPHGGPAQLIVTSYEHGVTALDPKTGKTLWEIDVFSKGHVESPIASPVVDGNLLLGCAGYLGVKKEVVALRLDRRDKDGNPAEAYRLVRGAPLVPTPLVKDGLVFLWNDDGVVTCADAGTGKVQWQERVEGTYYSSPVWANGHVYGVSREGDVVVLAAARKFEVVARNPLGEGSHATPAVVGGTMYLRTFTHLIAICKGG